MTIGKPLSGIRVVDLTCYLPGPLATLLLSDLGAEVIKVEAPTGGDPLRFMSPSVAGSSVLFHCLNRGKRFVTLDLKQEHDRRRFMGLLGESDCLFEGFRPDVLPRLGLDPVELVHDFPRLVIARLSGYGQDGPYASRPGHDLNYLSISGVLDGSLSEFPLPTQVADVGTSLLSISAVLATLLGASRDTAVERILDVPILDSALVFAMASHARGSGGDDPTPGHGLLEGGLATYRLYRDRDGRMVSVAALEPKFHEALVSIFGGADAVTLENSIGSISHDDLAKRREELPCVEPVLSLEEARNHPAVESRSTFKVMEWDDNRIVLPVTPFAAGDPTPRGPWASPPGSDNESVFI